MKIVSIFADQLFAFHYENEVDNEYDRLMNLWTDTGYLQAYAKENKVKNLYDFIDEILKDTEAIQDFLNDIQTNKEPHEFYFQPLQVSEGKYKILAFQKGKIVQNKLRLYAIKIDANCFVITGGAIKMSQIMQDHEDTDNELKKLNNARAYLNKEEVFDEDTFFELLNDEI